MRKSLVLMLAAMTMSLMFVASATSPMLNGFNPSGHQVSGKDSAVQDASSKTPDAAGAKASAKTGAKCCNEKVPIKDASVLSVLRGKVLDKKTGAPVAGALVVLQPVDAGVEIKTDPVRPTEGAASIRSSGCEKKQDSSGCCGNGGARDAQTGQDATQPAIKPTKPPVPTIIPVPQPIIQTKSDAKGIYSIQIKPGDFILNVMAEGYLPFFGEVGVPKATKFDHDVALAPAPVPDCRIEGIISSAADGKRLPGANVLIIRLPADFPFSGETLKEMVARYLGDKPLEPAMTPEQAAEMKEKEAQRQIQDSNGQLTDEQIIQMKEKLAQEQNTDASGQLTDEGVRLMNEKLANVETGTDGQRVEEQRVPLKEILARLTEKLNEKLTDEQRGQIMREIEGVKARMALQQEIEKKTSEKLNPKAPQESCPKQLPQPPVPTLPTDPLGMVMPETISLLTDEKGHFEAKLFSGRVLVIAFSRGYDPQWALLDIPAKSSISLQLNLEKSGAREPDVAAPVRQPPVLPDMDLPDVPTEPR